jgi:hypothetical protein
MSVVAAFLYRDGRQVRPISIDEPTPCTDKKSEFVWMGLLEPTEGELRTLAHQYGLHPLAVEDALKAHQLPKVDVFGDQLFVVVRPAHMEADRIEYGETAIFVGRTHIITVRHGSRRAHSDLRDQLEATPARLAYGVDYVLHAKCWQGTRRRSMPFSRARRLRLLFSCPEGAFGSRSRMAAACGAHFRAGAGAARSSAGRQRRAAGNCRGERRDASRGFDHRVRRITAQQHEVRV